MYVSCKEVIYHTKIIREGEKKIGNERKGSRGEEKKIKKR